MLYLLIVLLLTSCADMHSPLLHGGGVVKFIPHIQYDDVDSIALSRMDKLFMLDWNKDFFIKRGLNDFHVNWYSSVHNNSIDFIGESENIDIFYGKYNVIWTTNPYLNNIQKENVVYTEHLNDSICKLPDFIYCKKGEIYVSSSIHDYVYDEDTYIQVFEENLIQRTFFYVVQITLKNNNNRVKNSGLFSISGLAEKIDLNSDTNIGETSYVFNTTKKDDIIVGSFTSFGLPNCNPYIFRYDSRNGLIDQYANKNILYIQLVYDKGRKLINVDVSQQIRLQPTGGLILVDIDINEHQEPIGYIEDPFDVLISDYENTNNYHNKF